MMLLSAVTMIEKDEDREFILALYDKYNRLIYKKIRNKIGAQKDAEDLVNDTFIRLIEKIDVLKTLGEREIIYYIIQTSNHVSIDFIKRSAVRQKHIYYGNDHDICEEIAELEEAQYTYDERIGDLAEAISKLPERDSSLLIDKYYLDKTDKEIADEIGIQVSSVRQSLTRARRKARALMEKGDGENEK